MSRPWYREPETFIAVAALVVSVTAVIVGFYEASLQRKHDRAEVWPRVEIGTFTEPAGAVVQLENTGIGPALIKSITVTADDKPQHNWPEVLHTLLGRDASVRSNQTVADHGVRAGEHVLLLGIDKAEMPPKFWPWIQRVTVRVCYASVFDESWVVTARLGSANKWETVEKCPAQEAGVDF